MSTEPIGAVRMRRYRPGDERLLLDLLNGSLRGDGGRLYGEDFWRWKHADNPFGESYARFAWDERQGRVAALRALMRWEFRLPSGDTVRAVRAVDTATHPAYRRTGLFRGLTEAAVADLAAEGCGFIFNTPNAKSLPGYRAMGWSVVTRWPVFIRALRPLACAKALLGRRGAAAGGAEARFGPGVVPWEEFAARWGRETTEVVAAWEGSRPPAGLRTPRNPAYLTWRYGRHPAARYGVAHVSEGGRLAGFAVLRANRRAGLREVVLAELFLRPESAAAGRRLLREVVRGNVADYCVASFAAGTAERRLLAGALFLRVPGRGVTLAARVLNPTAAEPLRPGGWDLSLGDLEVF